ncbi:spore germination protein [Halothermothrix orenii]|uniref:GerA spore germination protein n=1 Tax=Halothermothrix orenii (strain H 168 / OCM 544 / DSM 9562) TaxID=373903 RepID=B8CZP3_HALOH|nr:spore germination protein [Halothermothrix orenii]ACL68773.1 GerA spore germination protein [Halothermothrix orenii H 168]
MNWERIKERIDEIISSNTDRPGEKTSKKKLTRDIKKNEKTIEDIIGFSDDVNFREFKLGKKLKIKATLIYIDSLVDKKTINESILEPLFTEEFFSDNVENLTTDDIVKFVRDNTMTINEVKVTEKLEDTIEGILNGDSVLLVDGYEQVMVLNTKGWEKRSVSEPVVESVIRGPRDGFTETLAVNTGLIRRRVKHPSLRIKNYNIGRFSKTSVSICYIEGIANKHLVEEVKERINNINIDNIGSSGFVEQLIEDSHLSPFPQILSTERPDRVAANLMEGRVAVVVDNTPFVLILPMTISIFFQSPEDYHERFLVANFIRIIRGIAAFLSLTLPSIYIALISFHPEMLPTRLALAFAGGRGMVPFPSYLEAFIMEGAMELLREASIRLPNPIGPTIGIVGALIVGEAAVSASIVSPFMVIIVAVTTIASFTIPDYGSAIALRILRFPLMVVTTIFGLYGLIWGLIAITIHLASLKSFGIPYLTPLAPSRLSDLKDLVVRAPFWLMYRRPKYLRTKDEKRFSSKGDDDQNERTR